MNFFLYLHTEWAKTRNLTGGNFHFHFQSGEITQFVSFASHTFKFAMKCAVYHIAGNFRGVQIFAFFADRLVTAKIKTTKFLTKLRTSRMAT